MPNMTQSMGMPSTGLQSMPGLSALPTGSGAAQISPQMSAGPGAGGAATAEVAQQQLAQLQGQPAQGQPAMPAPQAAPAQQAPQSAFVPNSRGQILYAPGQGPVTEHIAKVAAAGGFAGDFVRQCRVQGFSDARIIETAKVASARLPEVAGLLEPLVKVAFGEGLLGEGLMSAATKFVPRLATRFAETAGPALRGLPGAMKPALGRAAVGGAAGAGFGLADKALHGTPMSWQMPAAMAAGSAVAPQAMRRFGLGAIGGMGVDSASRAFLGKPLPNAPLVGGLGTAIGGSRLFGSPAALSAESIGAAGPAFRALPMGAKALVGAGAAGTVGASALAGRDATLSAIPAPIKALMSVGQSASNAASGLGDTISNAWDTGSQAVGRAVNRVGEATGFTGAGAGGGGATGAGGGLSGIGSGMVDYVRKLPEPAQIALIGGVLGLVGGGLSGSGTASTLGILSILGGLFGPQLWKLLQKYLASRGGGAGAAPAGPAAPPRAPLAAAANPSPPAGPAYNPMAGNVQ